MSISRDHAIGIFKALINPNSRRSEFDKRWIEWISFEMPRFSSENLRAFRIACNNEIGKSHFSVGHIVLFDSLQDIVRRAEGGESFFAADHLIGYGLDETCDLYPEHPIQWVFEALPSEKIARDLLTYQIGSSSAHLAQFLQFLDTRKVINVHNWNQKTTWPLGESRGLFSKRNVPESAISKRSQPINPELARRYPLLQQAMDEIAAHPAYPTVEPIVRKLVKHVARFGSLGRHIALLGPPGVGKTASAELLHKVLAGMDFTGHRFQVFSPGKDVEHHVDEMASTLRSTLNDLKETGGVLLMDEASKMRERNSSANDPANFRKRAMDVVMEQLGELEKDGVVVIFAGYQNEFNEVLCQDDGWPRRVLQIPIDPPSVDLLADFVFEHFNKQQIAVPGNFHQNVEWLFSEMIEDDSIGFGYWGTVQNFIQSLEASAQGDILFGSSLDVEVITKEDFIEAARDIGFVNVSIFEREFTPPIGALDVTSEIDRVDSIESFNRLFGDGR